MADGPRSAKPASVPRLRSGTRNPRRSELGTGALPTPPAACLAVIVLCSKNSAASPIVFRGDHPSPVARKGDVPIRLDDGAVDPVLAGQQIIDLHGDRTDSVRATASGSAGGGNRPDRLVRLGWEQAPLPRAARASREQDAAVFFGHDERDQCRPRSAPEPSSSALLRRHGRRRRQASGSGKSSLVAPGWYAASSRHAAMDSRRTLRPRDRPIEELSAAAEPSLHDGRSRRDRSEINAVLRGAIEEAAVHQTRSPKWPRVRRSADQ